MKQSIKLAALVGAVLGLGVIGFAPAADAHSWHDNWKPISVKVQASGQSEWHTAYSYPQGAYGANHFQFWTERLSAGPHVEFVTPYPYPPVTYQANIATLQVKLELANYIPVSAKVEIVWKRVGAKVSSCDSGGQWPAYQDLAYAGTYAQMVGADEMKVVFQSSDPTEYGHYLKVECQDSQGTHIVHAYVQFFQQPGAVELEWRQWKQSGAESMFGPTGGAWSQYPMNLPVKPGYFNEEGGYGVRARAAGLPNAKWTAWRDFCIGDPAKCYVKNYQEFLAEFAGKFYLVKMSGADLTVAKFWVETLQPGEKLPGGQTAQKPHWYFVWRVENIGDKHAGSTTLKITCEPQGGSPPCPTGVAKSYDVGNFWPKPEDPEEAKAKEYAWAALKWNSQPVPAPDTPVKWKFTASVDPDNKVAEKDELNNVLVSNFPSMIDLSTFAEKFVGFIPKQSGEGSQQEGSGQEQRQQLPGPRAALQRQRQAADEAARDLDALAKRLTPLQQDREAQLLLRDIQALQRELATGPQPGEVDRLRRDAERLSRETDRLEASLRREQQRAAAASPAPGKPAAPEAAAPAPESQPGEPAGPPKIAAVPRPAMPARDPVAEQAAKELETLARRLTAMGANPEAQRLLREVQLLQRQLGGDQGQAPAILRDAQRLSREVDRLEAALRQPATTPRLGPQAPVKRLR